MLVHFTGFFLVIFLPAFNGKVNSKNLHLYLETDEGAHALVFVVPVEDGLQLPDGDLRVEVGRGGLDPVDVPFEDRVLELDVRLVLVLELLRVEGAHAGAKLELQRIIFVRVSVGM